MGKQEIKVRITDDLPIKSPVSEKVENMSTRDKISYFFNNMTVEPMVACYIMPSVLAQLAVQNLNLEKACRVNLHYSSHVCDALSIRDTANYTQQETEVQQLVAKMIIWKTALQSALPAFLILFIGSWSDRHRCRKPCMIVPIVGELLSCIGLIICTYFFYELPMEVSGVIEGLLPALTGGWFTMFMAIFSYIADVTSEDMRTLRIGLANVVCSLGIPVGIALSGVLYAEIGFYGIFSLSASLYLLSILYGMVRIKEVNRPVSMTTAKNKSAANASCGILRDFFDLKHLSETFRVAFKQDSNGRKKKVIAIMIIVCVVIGPMHGEMAVMYLFTRYRFNWNEIDYSIYSTYNVIVNLIGTSISVGIFSHVLKMDDSMIGVLSCSSKILSSFVYAFAPTSWVFYLGAIVEALNGTSFIAMRSMASKLVPSDELGKVNSLFGVCEALMPLLYGPLYSAVYAATMHTFPGAFYVLGGILTMPALILFLWLYTDAKQNSLDQLDDISKEAYENKAFESDIIYSTKM